jgi:TonB-dependent SusC/RagA subfamily outer membrane receptor
MKTSISIIMLFAFSSAYAQNNNSLQDSTKELEHKVFRVDNVVDLTGPLYYLEGKEVTEKEVSKINANDIESITVLKDSATTILYGKRAALGVILIALKTEKYKYKKLLNDKNKKGR